MIDVLFRFYCNVKKSNGSILPDDLASFFRDGSSVKSISFRLKVANRGNSPLTVFVVNRRYRSVNSDFNRVAKLSLLFLTEAKRSASKKQFRSAHPKGVRAISNLVFNRKRKNVRFSKNLKAQDFSGVSEMSDQWKFLGENSIRRKDARKKIRFGPKVCPKT